MAFKAKGGGNNPKIPNTGQKSPKPTVMGSDSASRSTFNGPPDKVKSTKAYTVYRSSK